MKQMKEQRKAARAAKDKVTKLQEQGHTVESSAELNDALDASADSIKNLPWILR